MIRKEIGTCMGHRAYISFSMVKVNQFIRSIYLILPDKNNAKMCFFVEQYSPVNHSVNIIGYVLEEIPNKIG